MSSIPVVIVRILAAYVILSNFAALTTYLSMPIVTRDMRDVLWSLLATPTVMIGLGMLILILSRRLAALASKGLPKTTLAMPDSQRLLSIGTALIGIFLVAVPRFFALGDVTSASDVDLRIAQQGIVASFATSVGSMIVGVLMLRLSPRIAGIRHTRLVAPASNAAQPSDG
jgi:hypothetical protein